MAKRLTSFNQLRPPIRYAYFDLGGTVCSFSGGLEAIAEIVNQPLSDVKVYWLERDSKICVGELAPQEFWKGLVQHFGAGDRDMDFLTFWINHLSPIQETHDFMQSLLSNGVEIGLISNTYSGVVEGAIKQGSIPDLSYQSVILSCYVGMLKPDPQIFHYALSQANVLPNQVVLIDDQAANLDIAERLGWNTLAFPLSRN